MHALLLLIPIFAICHFATQMSHSVVVEALGLEASATSSSADLLITSTEEAAVGGASSNVGGAEGVEGNLSQSADLVKRSPLLASRYALIHFLNTGKLNCQ